MTFDPENMISVQLGSAVMNTDFSMFVVWWQLVAGKFAKVVSVGKQAGSPGSVGTIGGTTSGIPAGQETGLSVHPADATHPTQYYDAYYYGVNYFGFSKRQVIDTNQSDTVYPLAAVVQTGIRSAGNLTGAINGTPGNTVPLTGASNGTIFSGNTAPTGTNTNTTLTLGSIDYPITAHVCELLVYSVALSKVQQDRIEAYLAWKWGLQDSLDASSPFRDAKPA